MKTMLNNMPDDAVDLKVPIEVMRQEIEAVRQEYESHIQILEEQIRLLKEKLFGRKSEKYKEGESEQLHLFNEAEEIVESTPQESESREVASYNRKKSGRRPLPQELPRVEQIYDLSEEEKVCPCGCTRQRIGEEVSEKLDIVPAKIQVIRIIRYKYACKNCEGVEDEAGAVQTAELPPQLIPQGIATPGLAAYLLTGKFVDGLPFYRQEKIFQRLGVDISRATMAGWAIHVAQSCEPLIELLNLEIRSGPVINIDETTVQVMKEPGRDNTSKSYMWVFRGGRLDAPVVIYQYHSTRSGSVAQNFLTGYEGYVQTDGYSGYNCLELMVAIILVGCWAHARRKFVEVITARPKGTGKAGSADVALSYIRKLYAIERRAVEMGLSVEAIYRLRQEESKPILIEFKAWLDVRVSQVPPTSLLGKAIGYTLNQWERLIRYIDDGRLRIDNNIIENDIRPFAVGRKNWLFSGHPRGAQASASLYSLIETAKANGLEPYLYLRFVFERLPFCQTQEDYKKLLPQYVSKKDLASIGQQGVN